MFVQPLENTLSVPNASHSSLNKEKQHSRIGAASTWELPLIRARIVINVMNWNCMTRYVQRLLQARTGNSD